jgi:hypothetical protein
MAHVGDTRNLTGMYEGVLESLAPEPRVPVAAAAELTGVREGSLRDWARAGALVIERRGDMEVVQLHEVEAVAARKRKGGRESLRERLREAPARASLPGSVDELQHLARQRSGRQDG